ncbi:hypothetical protein CHU71_11585 [Corynebacterium sp. LK14]|uniref:MFS transporter n=1 Tax=Corynebacterium TaxID=1716 RepID=UPI0011C98E64|nr:MULTISPECIES: MFS transporter [Corynebacterium]TXS61684.1 hypothetical protein CHU71_11585 [Corynebacterium sp. LK14]
MTFPAPQSPQQTPQAPTAAQAPQAPQAPQPEKERPEAVSLMLKLWAGALGFEVIHQILNVVMTLLNRSVLFAEARKTAEEAAKDSGQEISDSLISIIGYGSVAFSSLISLVIIVVLAVMLYLLNKNKKSAGTGRRLWFAFSLFFAFRTLLVFLSSPAGSEAQDWLIMVDGTVQILVGVAAVMGLIFSVKEETLDYTGELEEMRKLEQELAQERRDKERERREQERKELLEKQQKTSEHDAPRDSGRYDQEPRR